MNIQLNTKVDKKQFGELDCGDVFLDVDDDLCIKLDPNQGDSANAAILKDGATYEMPEGTEVTPISGFFMEATK